MTNGGRPTGSPASIPAREPEAASPGFGDDVHWALMAMVLGPLCVVVAMIVFRIAALALPGIPLPSDPVLGLPFMGLPALALALVPPVGLLLFFVALAGVTSWRMLEQFVDRTRGTWLRAVWAAATTAVLLGMLTFVPFPKSQGYGFIGFLLDLLALLRVGWVFVAIAGVGGGWAALEMRDRSRRATAHGAVRNHPGSDVPA